MFKRAVRIEMYNYICCSGFSIYIYVKVGVITVYSDVQKIDVFAFHCVVITLNHYATPGPKA